MGTAIRPVSHPARARLLNVTDNLYSVRICCARGIKRVSQGLDGLSNAGSLYPTVSPTHVIWAKYSAPCSRNARIFLRTACLRLRSGMWISSRMANVAGGRSLRTSRTALRAFKCSIGSVLSIERQEHPRTRGPPRSRPSKAQTLSRVDFAPCQR